MTDRELIVLGICSPIPRLGTVSEDGSVLGAAFASGLYWEFRAELAACLPPAQEAALRRTQVRPQLVPAPEPVRVPTPSSRTWPWLLGFGAAVLLWLGWAGWFR